MSTMTLLITCGSINIFTAWLLNRIDSLSLLGAISYVVLTTLMIPFTLISLLLIVPLGLFEIANFFCNETFTTVKINKKE